MAVWRFTASTSSREENVETGTVKARTENEAREKLRKHHFDKVRLKKLAGLSGFFKEFSADIK